MISKNDWIKLKRDFATKGDLNKLVFSLREEMRALELRIEDKAMRRHSEIFDLVDGLAQEIRDSRDFRVVVSHQLDEVRDRLGKLEG